MRLNDFLAASTAKAAADLDVVKCVALVCVYCPMPGTPLTTCVHHDPQAAVNEYTSHLVNDHWEEVVRVHQLLTGTGATAPATPEWQVQEGRHHERRPRILRPE